MPLVDQPFADTFAFSRARAAEYLDAAGLPAEAAVDAPRFDHTAEAVPRGLLIEGRPEFAAADRLSVQAGDWAVKGGTVLHEYETPAGTIERRAWYALNDPGSVVDSCLNIKGRHRRIAYLTQALPNRGGMVRWRDLLWSLGGFISAGGDDVLGAADDIPIIEG